MLTSKVRTEDVLLLNKFLTKPQKFILTLSSTWSSFKIGFVLFSLHLKRFDTTLISAGSAQVDFKCLRQDLRLCFEKSLYLVFNSNVFVDLTLPELCLK